MKPTHAGTIGLIALVLASAGFGTAKADELVVNGTFSGSLNGWTVAVEPGSAPLSTWYLISRTDRGSPVNGFPVPALPSGTGFAAMTDQLGKYSGVIYQDMHIPAFDIASATLSFDKFVGNRGGAFFIPDSLDFNPPANQQARVDLLTASSGPFSVGTGLLRNIYRTNPGDPLVDPNYVHISMDVLSVVRPLVGQSLRIRFAEVDSLFFFNFSVTNVSVNIQATVPEPASIALATWGAVALGIVALMRLCKRRFVLGRPEDLRES